MRGWPKGKPRKVVQQPTIQPKVEANFNESVGVAGSGGDSMDFAPDERMALYQEAAKQLYPDQVTEIPPEDGEGKVTETPETGKEVEKPAEEVLEPKKDETVTVTEPTEPVQATEKKPEEIKTVPYGALHEERMKRKDLQREIDDVKAKMNQLMEDNVKLMSKGTETTGNEYEPVYKGELDELRAKNLRLETEVGSIKQRFQTEDVRKGNDEAKRLMDEVDKQEAAAGRPGFSKIGWRVVLDEINQIAQTDPDLADSYRTPDGWKLIHAKKFPEIQEVYIAQNKKDVFDKKIEAKTGAGLVTNTGKAPEKTAPEQKTVKEQWDDYIKMRSKLNL